MLLLRPSLFFPERGHLRGKRDWGAVKGGTLTPGHPLGMVVQRPRGNRTWNLDWAARSVQGPLSAAAGIDTARPWGQISLPKSLWPREALTKARPGWHRAAAFAWRTLLWGNWAGLSVGTRPGLTLDLGSPETAAGGAGGGRGGGGWGGRLDLTAPLLLRPSTAAWSGMRPEAPGKSLTLRWPHLGLGVYVSEKAWAVLGGVSVERGFAQPRSPSYHSWVSIFPTPLISPYSEPT